MTVSLYFLLTFSFLISLFGLQLLFSSLLIEFVPLILDLTGFDFVASKESFLLFYSGGPYSSPIVILLQLSRVDFNRLSPRNFVHVYGCDCGVGFDPNIYQHLN